MSYFGGRNITNESSLSGNPIYTQEITAEASNQSFELPFGVRISPTGILSSPGFNSSIIYVSTGPISTPSLTVAGQSSLNTVSANDIGANFIEVDSISQRNSSNQLLLEQNGGLQQYDAVRISSNSGGISLATNDGQPVWIETTNGQDSKLVVNTIATQTGNFTVLGSDAYLTQKLFVNLGIETGMLNANQIKFQTPSTTKQIGFDPSNNSNSTSLTNRSNQTTSQTIDIPNVSSADSYVTNNTTATLTNKSLSGSNNTFSNIPNSGIATPFVTVNGSTINLGSSSTETANTTNALTVGTGLQLNSGTTFNGSAARTIDVDSTVFRTGQNNVNTSQSCFIAYLNTCNPNLTGNGTIVNSNSGMTWSTVKNVGSSFSGGLFTVPVTGTYLVCAAWCYNGLNTNHQYGSFTISGSSSSPRFLHNPSSSKMGASYTTGGLPYSMIVPFDSGETITLSWNVDYTGGGGSQTVSLYTGDYTWWSIALLF